MAGGPLSPSTTGVGFRGGQPVRSEKSTASDRPTAIVPVNFVVSFVIGANLGAGTVVYVRLTAFFAGVFPNSFRSSSLARSSLDLCAAVSCLPARLI